MLKYAIDGVFLCKKITGIQRYAIEITKELDKLLEPGVVEIVVPEKCTNDLGLKNICAVRYGNHSERLWEQIDFPQYLRERKLQGIFFENTIPVFYRKGIVVVHDVSLRANPDLFGKSIKGILKILWRRFMYSIIMRSQMKIVTVSNFSKKEIIKYYHVKAERITVIYNAWQHMQSIQPDKSVFDNTKIVPGKYFFALATLAPNKNFTWIAKTAKNNLDEVFVIAGGGEIKDVIEGKYQRLNNLVYLGYVSDEQAKALMGGCKAFLFPSFYEGFGIPPLEALASGCARLILSDTECLREIYGDQAMYVDPFDYNTNLDDMRELPVETSVVLKRYSWEKSAQELIGLL